MVLVLGRVLVVLVVVARSCMGRMSRLTRDGRRFSILVGVFIVGSILLGELLGWLLLGWVVLVDLGVLCLVSSLGSVGCRLAG